MKERRCIFHREGNERGVNMTATKVDRNEKVLTSKKV